MKFDAAWIVSQLERKIPYLELAARLTEVGFAVETREESGDSEVWEVDVTTNRPDAMNHRGLAREAAAATGYFLKPMVVEISEALTLTSDLATVEVEAPELCSRYAARVIEGVSICPSPDWLCERLERCGVRPINAIVDATNYVLLELGQPLHAFDLDRLAGSKIVVRRARTGEKLTTLDEVERELDSEMLVIADAERPIALAGIMGGGDSEIDENTTRILIESAHFDALSVRRTARRLGMHTEASHRFERGADPLMVDEALDLVATLIAKLAGGEIARGAIEIRQEAPEPTEIRIEASRLARFAGLPIDTDIVQDIFDKLGFKPRVEGDSVSCLVPSYRIDLERREDLYEEVLRHVGYDRIPPRLPVLGTKPGERRGAWPLIDRSREAVINQGFDEIITYSFIDPDDQQALAGSPLDFGESELRLDNPLSNKQSVMRRSMLANLLRAVATNRNAFESEIAIFEQGRAFAVDTAGVALESERLALALSGSLGDGDAGAAFFALKGVVERLLEEIGLIGASWRRAAPNGILANAQGAELILDDETIGIVGRLGQDQAKAFGLEGAIWVAELVLDSAQTPAEPRFVELERFPPVSADLTIEHPVELEWASIDSCLREHSDALVRAHEIVARYRGKQVRSGHQRTTVRLTYRHHERSLTQGEVNEAQNTLREALIAKLDVRFA